jgi:NAD(P)-dependent dehydrogenase (short-subunit alcohol dehydrogenase family)
MTGTPVEGGSARVDRPHQGRVALITGGSHGIGQSVAVELARRGAHVVIGARTDQSETVQFVAEAGGEALALTLDISDPASVEEARARVEAGPGRVDILVNNAATFETATSTERSHGQSLSSLDARAWLGPRDQHRVGISRDRCALVDLGASLATIVFFVVPAIDQGRPSLSVGSCSRGW